MCKKEDRLYHKEGVRGPADDFRWEQMFTAGMLQRMTLAETEFVEWCHRQGSNGTPDSDVAKQELWDKTVEDNLMLIRDILDHMEVPYREYMPRRDTYAFKFNVTIDRKKLHMKVCLEFRPGLCRIDAVYPFRADPEYIDPLFSQLAKENCSGHYAVLRYDASNRKMFYQYCLSTVCGLQKGDFCNAFVATVLSALASYDTVKRYAAGGF